MIGRNVDYRPGNRVAFLNEKQYGIVTRITNKYVYVDVGDGFELPVLPSDLILIKDDSSSASNQVETEAKIAIDSKDIKSEERKNNLHFKSIGLYRGVYLALVPDNQETLVGGNLQLYLINYTKIPLYYILYLPYEREENNQYHNFIDEASAVSLFQIDRKSINVVLHGCIQIMFLKSTNRGIALPVNVFFQIRQKCLINTEKYQFFDELQAFAQIIKLLRFEELEWLQIGISNDSNVIYAKNVEGDKLEQKAYIEKYKVSENEAEVDLRIDKIIDNTQDISEIEKLNIRLQHFCQCIESAIQNKYKRIVFIHGLASGTLKAEMHKILGKYPNLYFRDAPISKYGLGATEVYIK